MRALDEIAAEFERLDAQVLGVSCDSRFSLAAWKQAMGYGVRLVSDFWPHGRIGQAYGVFDDELGIHRRGTFLVDPAGVVRRVISTPDVRTPRDVQHYLEALGSI